MAASQPFPIKALFLGALCAFLTYVAFLTAVAWAEEVAEKTSSSIQHPKSIIRGSAAATFAFPRPIV